MRPFLSPAGDRWARALCAIGVPRCNLRLLHNARPPLRKPIGMVRPVSHSCNLAHVCCRPLATTTRTRGTGEGVNSGALPNSWALTLVLSEHLLGVLFRLASTLVRSEHLLGRTV